MESIHRLSLLLHLLLLLFIAAPVLMQTTRLSLIPFIHINNNNYRTWSEAQSYCREHHTDLITIRNAQENNGQGWIGLYRENSSSRWRWSRGEEMANFTPWAYGEPYSNENCAFKYSHEYVWHGENCNTGHSFMCYHERLLLVQENKTWEEAMHHCRALKALDPSNPPTAYGNNRYDLASLTLGDHTYAGNIAQSATTDEVWIGLRFLADRWFWMGGEAVSYQNLPQCTDGQYCGALKKTGDRNWMPTDCTKKMNFFCYDKKNLPP